MLRPRRSIALLAAGSLTAALACFNPVPAHAVDACGTTATAVGSVQGAGTATTMSGHTVTVEGIVVGDFQDGGFNGYYLQDAGDNNPATSDGIFIYGRGGGAVSPGDVVRVTGKVSEYQNLTEITASTAVSCGTSAQPEAVPLQLPLSASQLEAVEGMRVSFPQSLTILEYYNFARYGEIVLGTSRQFQPTAVYAPGSAEATALAASNAAHRITMDDGRSNQNPDPAIHPNGQEFTTSNGFRGGDLVTNATGVLDQRFGGYRLQPTQGAEVTSANPRPGVPDVGGNIQVASFNVLNYFTTLDSRGAVTAEEFRRQEAKIVAAINTMDAEVVGLLEIENNNGVALNTLVAALNKAAGYRKWQAIRTGTLGTDEITTALIFQPSKVVPVDTFAVLDSSVDPDFDTSLNRPALAQTFIARGSGLKFTMAVNHLKSKGSSCADVGDPEDPNGQGNCNQVRTRAAAALVKWLASDPTETGSDKTLIVGDLNSYDHEDPITAILQAGYVDLVKKYGGEYAYSYVFDGLLGYLDHGLANPAMAARVTGAAEWHINADEVPILDYTMAFKADAQDNLWEPTPYRASDHDAVLIGIDTRTRPAR